MKSLPFTAVSIALIVLAVGVSLFSPWLALTLIGTVLLAALALLVFRIWMR